MIKSERYPNATGKINVLLFLSFSVIFTSRSLHFGKFSFVSFNVKSVLVKRGRKNV